MHSNEYNAEWSLTSINLAVTLYFEYQDEEYSEYIS